MRNFFKDRRFKRGLNATVLTIAIIGIVILLNVLLSRYSYRKDLTANKNFELSDQTKTVLSNLDKSGKVVNVYLFTGQNMDEKTKNMIEGLLEVYQRSSKNFKLQILDREKNPGLATKYQVAGDFDAAFDQAGRTRTVSIDQLYEGMNFNAESAYTSAIMNVMNENPPVVYFIQGHKEANLDKDATILKRYVGNEGYVIKTLNIGLEGKIPEDASLVVDLGAKTDFAPKEIDVLRGYLDAGGRAVILASTLPDTPQTAALMGMLKGYGIQLNNDITIDPSRNFKGAADIVAPQYLEHDIVNKIKDQPQYYMFVPDSRSIDVLGNVNDIKIDPLINTSNAAWGETSLDQYNNQKIKFDANDKKGPLNLAVYAAKTLPDAKQMKLVVLGGELLVYDNALQVTSAAANLDFVLNSMSYLTDNKQNVTIRSKPIDVKPLNMVDNKRNVIFYTLVLFLPGLVLATGLTIWLRRRHL